MSGPRQYFFCISPGRSGSQYLSMLLGTDPRVAAFHEAPPEMNGDLLRLAERAPYADTYAARRFKAVAVRELLARQGGRSVYAETSHMFIKTFFDVAMEELSLAAGERVGVVILRRELVPVLKSFADLGIFTPRNPAWPAWMSSPYAATRAIEPAAPEGTLDPLELTVAYLVDIEARAQRFLRDYPAADVFHARIEDFSDPSEIERLFEWADLAINDDALAMCNRPINERKTRKAAIAADVSRDACEDAVARYLQRCADAGIEVPPTLATAAPVRP